MKKLLATAALILATATSAFAGFSERQETDRITGSKTYVGTSTGQVLNPTWYNDENAFIAIRCHDGNRLTIAVSFGEEVLDGSIHDRVYIEYNANGIVGSTFMDELSSNGLVVATPVINRKKGQAVLPRNSFTRDLWNAGSGTLTMRAQAYGRGPVEMQVPLTGFREAFKNAAWSCGLPFKPENQ